MRVVLYTTGCPKCKILTQKLDAANIQYEKNNDVELMTQKGFATVPMLEIDGAVYNYKEAVKWIGEQ